MIPGGTSRIFISAIAWAVFALSAAEQPKSPAKAGAAKPAPKAGAVKRPASSLEFDRLVKEAATARDANRIDEAIDLYRKAVKLRPGWPEGWWWVGTMLYDTDRYAEARDAFQKFVGADPKAAPGFALLGLCEFQTKQYDKAIAHLEHARQMGIGDNVQLANVAMYHDSILLTKYEQYEPAGKLLLELGRRMNCTPAIVEASGLASLRLPLLPSEVPLEKRELVLKLGHAVCLAGDRRGNEAQKEFEEIVKGFPNETNVHYTFASFLLATDADRAVAEFDKTLALEPSHLPALVSLSAEYLKRGETDKAIEYAEKAVQYGPRSFATHASLGKALVDGGQLQKGIKELELAAEMAPDSPQTRIALATAYSKAGRKEDAARERAEFLRLKKQINEQTPTPQP